MNGLQKIELDMLKEVIGICEKLRLQYFLICGSALGAVKYGGFIPWDDDVDIGLPREDYEVFLERGQALLPEHLFLQNYHTDLAFPQLYSKIRNIHTTFIEKSVARLPICHGVFIDIFPLDGYPGDDREAARLERKKRIYELRLACVYRPVGFSKSQMFFAMERTLGIHKRSGAILKRMENLLSRYGTRTSRLWCNHAGWQGKAEYMPREWYGQGVMAQFEGLNVRIPEKYDAYLTQKYGNWRRELPKSEQIGHHSVEVVDLNRPYTDYLPRCPKSKNACPFRCRS